MIKLKYIFVFLVLTSTSCFSQTSFNNLDSLLTKTFQTVNNRDSISYLKLIDQKTVFNGKKVKTKKDSLLILQPFLDSFSELTDNLEDMTVDPNFTVMYSDYELINRNQKLPENGPIRLHANMIVNNTFSVKMPMHVMVKDGLYSIDSPMMVMFLEGKE